MSNESSSAKEGKDQNDGPFECETQESAVTKAADAYSLGCSSSIMKNENEIEDDIIEIDKDWEEIEGDQ